VVRTSGSLEFCELNKEKQIVVASDLKAVDWPKADNVQAGWYYFSKGGKLLESAKKSFVIQTTSYHHSTYVHGGDQWLPPDKKESVQVIKDEEYTTDFGN
jgi:hypothetical protein